MAQLTQWNFNNLNDVLRPSDKMPIMFIGHGSPMNAINNSDWAKGWAKAGAALPEPQAILCISAHWMTRGETLVNVQKAPPTIHDFGAFPQALFDVQYPAEGAPDVAQDVLAMLRDHDAKADEDWGLDHGAWSVLRLMYPDANIPVFQMSIDMSRSFAEHMEIGAQLRALRQKGVLVLGSGNLVHNLRDLRFDGGVYDWALEFDAFAADAIASGAFDRLRDLDRRSHAFRLAHPTPDHFIPAMYCLGLVEETDSPAFFNEGIDFGTTSMRSFLFS